MFLLEKQLDSNKKNKSVIIVNRIYLSIDRRKKIMSRYQLTEVKLRSVIKEELRKVLKEIHTKDHTMESDNYSEAVSGLDPIMVDEISEEDINRYLEVMSLEELIQTKTALSYSYLNNGDISKGWDYYKYGFNVGAYVYAIETGTDFYNRALVVAKDDITDIYTIQFDDLTVQTVTNVNELLIYFPCGKC